MRHSHFNGEKQLTFANRLRGTELEVVKLEGGIFENVDSLRKELDHRDLLFDVRGLPDGSTLDIEFQNKPHGNSVSHYNGRNLFGRYRTNAVEQITASRD